MKFLIIVLMFFIIGALLVISNNNLALIQPENFGIFSEKYVEWLDKVFSNSQTITGNVVKLDWAP